MQEFYGTFSYFVPILAMTNLSSLSMEFQFLTLIVIHQNGLRFSTLFSHV